MNIYLRYFDNETLVKDAEEALSFLRSIPEINVDEFLERELCTYIDGKMQYPKRFKVSNRAYFIVIKTTAESMDAFKAAGLASRDSAAERAEAEDIKERLSAVKPGWYEATLLFKRVVSQPETQKFQYVDTTFSAKLKAQSIQDCYYKVVAHLRNREDIDPRSQYPSVKGRNFKCTFLEEA